MEYNIYAYSDKKEDLDPVIHKTLTIGGFDASCNLILQESAKYGVLVYATGQLYDQLVAEEIATAVTEKTSYLDLENMDKPNGSHYPRFIINDKYGGRGLNFRTH